MEHTSEQPSPDADRNAEVESVEPILTGSEPSTDTPPDSPPDPSPLRITDADHPGPITTPTAVVTTAEAAALSLTGPQRSAIIQLTSGRTRADAARAAGVTRATLYRWLNTDPGFQAAYNAWQKDMIGTAQAELLAGTRDAITTVITAIRNGDAKLAWKLLQSQGMTTKADPGSTDIEELERRLELARKKQDIAARKERRDVKMDDLITMDDL